VEIVAGVITAVTGGVAAILAAWALVRKAGQSTVREALMSLWDWCEFEQLTDQMPERISRACRKALERDEQE
jgi:hypothetical protein